VRCLKILSNLVEYIDTRKEDLEGKGLCRGKKNKSQIKEGENFWKRKKIQNLSSSFAN